MFKTKLLSIFLATSVAGGGLVACNDSPRGTDRWVTTENTNVQIDWNKVNEAYKQAEGPEDLEKRINEIYEGDEIISVSVKDQDAKTQVVTGFFDKNTNGTVEDGEKIFTIQRNITGENQAQSQIVGYGPYAGYHSPVWDIATGMLLGSMISRAFSPGYSPMYYGGYTTSPMRVSQLDNHRSSYRASQPSRFSKSTQSGRSWGTGTRAPSRPSSGGFRPSRGGGSFGAAPRTQPVRRLAA